MTAVPQDLAFTHREKLIIIVGLMLSMFLAALDQTIIATALPRISGDLHGAAHLSWIVSAYLLTSTAATPIYGKLSDLYGRKIMLQVAITIFFVASILCGTAQTMLQLILFRALQGFGGGGLLVMAHATIGDVISPRERGRYQGYIGSTFAASSVAGPVLGGLFVDHLTWRWVFWINLPIAIGALAMSQIALKRLVPKLVRHRIDYPGAVLIVLAILSVLLVTTTGGNEYAWDSPVIEFLLFSAFCLFGLVIVQERRASEPILPLRLFANPVFSICNLIGLLSSMVVFGAIIFLPMFFQLAWQLRASEAGTMLIPLSVAIVVGAVSSGRLVAKTGRYKVFPLVGLVLAAAGMAMLSRMSVGAPLYIVAALMVVGGVGMGMTMPVMVVAVQNAVAMRDLGTATASVSFFRSMGGSFGVALCGAVFIGRLNTLIAQAGVQGITGLELIRAGSDALNTVPAGARPIVLDAVTQAFHTVFLVAAGIASLAFICALWLRELPLRTSAAVETAIAVE